MLGEVLELDNRDRFLIYEFYLIFMGIIDNDLRKFADKGKAKILQGFFKTGKGQYGEGDVFWGVSVPDIRKVVRVHWKNIEIGVLKKLLSSDVHEKRLLALLILVEKYNPSSNRGGRRVLFNFYLANVDGVNNWDLVDLSAPNIIGNYLLNKKDRKVLIKLAKSENLWERRIGIIATLTFIRAGEFDDTLKISKILLKDSHDLIHKAVGWMLREVGKRDLGVEEDFLKIHYKNMPRTMLRYSIEKFDENKRKKYLRGEI